MDFSAGSLVSSLIIGLIGMAMIVYARKSERPAPFVGGVALCVFPYFVHSLIVMWLIAAACIAGTWVIGKAT